LGGSPVSNSLKISTQFAAPVAGEGSLGGGFLDKFGDKSKPSIISRPGEGATGLEVLNKREKEFSNLSKRRKKDWGTSRKCGTSEERKKCPNERGERRKAIVGLERSYPLGKTKTKKRGDR